VLVTGKDTDQDQILVGHYLYQLVGRLVEPSEDVVELEAVELVLQLADFLGLWQLDSFMTWLMTSCESPLMSSHWIPGSMAMR
jgi:hypothetical protein